MIHDVIILGAGVAGLQCARRLSAVGAEVLVVDRADKPGGRCATRVFDGLPADYGPLFLHGTDDGFAGALRGVDAERIEGWPRRVSGRGTPCQPSAFDPRATRLAFTDGVNALPRSLSSGLEIRLKSLVATMAPTGDGVSVTLAGGEVLTARDLVLAFALEQSLALLRTLGNAARDPARDAARGAVAMLEMFTSIPCLSVVAGYDESVPEPGWDVLYPEDEPSLLLVSNESSKRPGPRGRVFVVQGSGPWSHRHLEDRPEAWVPELLGIAARRLGAWAATPAWTHPHRWRYARLDIANELAAPLQITIGRARVGVIGDLFAPGGGVQAAWMAGDRLGGELGGAR